VAKGGKGLVGGDFAEAEGGGGDFDVFVAFDVFEGVFEAEDDGRGESDFVVGA